jgi:CopG family nickel-responsive transcriptional regulator
MRRITISVDESLAQQFEDLIGRRGYANRSEAFRDLLRNHIELDRKGRFTALHCVATVSYIYNHHERELSRRLTAAQHDHHDLCITTSHVHLDHENCLETVILRGKLKAVSNFADLLIAQSGVRHGNVHIVPVQRDSSSKHRQQHVHLQPST